MKDIYIRTFTGAIFLIAILGSILLHQLAFFGVLFIFSSLALNEYFLLAAKNESRKHNLIFFFLGIIIYSLTGLIGVGLLDIRFAAIIIPLFLLVIVFELFRKINPSWTRIGIYFTGFVYVSIPFGLLNFFYIIPETDTFQVGILVGLFVIVWSSDVFAYLVGSMIGKHRILERISPKKSWEGSIGGLLFALLAAYILSLFFTQLSLSRWLIMAVIIVVFGTLGDFAESMLKRQAGVKDSGNLLPGHGGVLDRFDAVLFATPFVYFYLNLF
ncbi:MAG TPA: phosphatidate cytidylyltransferase [Bacteroidales bacterium]